MRTSALSTLVLAAIPLIAAQGDFTIQVNNKCAENIYVYQSTDGGCAYGVNSFETCSANPSSCFSGSMCGGEPWTITPQGTTYIPFVQDTLGTSMKIAKDTSFSSILQFEYTVNDVIYWDISLLNGGTGGTVGTPFENEAIAMGPITAGSDTCAYVKCSSSPCQDAYTSPWDADTRACPSTNSEFFIDLCSEL